MKHLYLLLLTLLFATAAVAQDTENEKVIRLSDPIIETDSYEVFGLEDSAATEDNWEGARSLASLIQSETGMEGQEGQEVVVETDVAQVCQKKGCFFVAQDGEYTARVTFKDYSFFVPTDAKGKTVKLAGVFNVKELTEDEAKHYAEDAGEDPDKIKGSQKEYSIVATSVLVPKSK